MRPKAATILFGLTIFVGAFLLFQVQPLIGKYILPWFGGSPAVWTACMLFFQIALLAGYAYAHALAKFLQPKVQMGMHLAVLVAAVALLPIVPAPRWMPPDASNPTGRILALLAVCVGAPYLVLAATGPLLQDWFGRVTGGRSPYRLYALSNTASMLALLSYPFLVEPNFTRTMQGKMWGWGLVGFAVICAVTAVISGRANQNPRPSSLPEYRERGKEQRRWLWIVLPACASLLLLAVTNTICQDIAVVPLLWVVPLSIYLLSFIICFDNPRWYMRKLFVPLMAILLAAVCGSMLLPEGRLTVFRLIALHCATLFACCMVCHGELYRLRPAANQLTSYYLMIAIGGAIGGVLVAVIAPVTLPGFYELHIGLVAAAVLAIFSIGLPRNTVFRGAIIIAVALLAVILVTNALSYLEGSTLLAQSRNFYGVLKVYDSHTDDPSQHQHVLQHGGTTHGLQFVEPRLRSLPTSYYGAASGIGLTMQTISRSHPLRVGVVGLGAGTVMAYGKSGDLFRVYEINPEVVRLAREYFTFLGDCQAQVEIVLGDARMSLAHEPSQQFDVLILDAFNGDAIPVHLLTRECFEIYLRHLRPGGMIAAHISNMHLRLAPVVLKIAEHFKLNVARIASAVDEDRGQYAAEWMLLTSDKAWLDLPSIRAADHPIKYSIDSIRLWTDEDTNLFQILN